MADAEITEFIDQCSEIDKYKLKVILSSQCIKAQIHTVKKIQNHIILQKYICGSMTRANTILEADLKLDEKKRKSLLSAIEIAKSANVELKKQLLLAKIEKQDIMEKKINDQKKYEKVWLEIKERFESIAFVKRYLKLNNRIEDVKQTIQTNNNEIEKLIINISIKKKQFLKVDQNMIVKLAKYLIYKRPIVWKQIKTKTTELNKLQSNVNKPIQEYLQKSNELLLSTNSHCANESTDNPLQYNLSNIILPTLKLQNKGYDLIPINFEQVKKMNSKVAPQSKRGNDLDVTSASNIEKKKYIPDQKIMDVSVSSYYSTPNTVTEIPNDCNSNSKLIHILQDIKLDMPRTYSIISNLKPNDFQDVNIIKSGHLDNKVTTQKLSQEKNFQEQEVNCNSLISSQNVMGTDSKTNEFHVEDSDTSHGLLDNTLNCSITDDDDLKKMKESFLKKYNLSPEFTYTKPLMFTVNKNKLEKKSLDSHHEDINITSKFFDDKKIHEDVGNGDNKESLNTDKNKNNELVVEGNADEPSVTITEIQKKVQKDDTIAIEYSHCVPTSSNLLNISMNTSDTEDFPHYSNILLSPKADNDQLSSNIQVLSQEVPNFLEGLKKTTYSFFEAKTTENKADSNFQSQNNFNFNLGSEEGTERSGFFKLF